MNLIQIIQNEINTDEITGNQQKRNSMLIIKRYNIASDSEKILMNTLFINLCGFSLETLIEKADK
jgi:hypothetical protein